MPDDSVFDSYEILDTIMEGRNSNIYRCSDKNRGREVAIKTLVRRAARRRKYRNQLYKEARIIMRCEHPNIIKLFAYKVSRRQPYYVMEYVQGRNLKQKIQHKEEIPDDLLKSIVLQVADAIAYLHSIRYLHKDVKPDNVLVDRQNQVRIIDFGLAERIGEKKSFLSFWPSRKVKGTRLYMSPEQIRGENLDVRTDIYSFGVLLYELLAKKTPFVPLDREMVIYQHLSQRPSSLHSRNPRITPEVDAVVLKMLEKDRNRRQHSMNEVIFELKRIDFFQDL